MARYLEELAWRYHDCRESCPALPFGGRGAPRDDSTIQARLWLVTAARAVKVRGRSSAIVRSIPRRSAVVRIDWQDDRGKRVPRDTPVATNFGLVAT